MNEGLESTRGSEWSRGWARLIGSSLATSAGGTLFVYTQHFFVDPLRTSLGWSRTEIALGGMLAFGASAIFMPIAGLLTDKFGARRVGPAGIFCVGLSFVLLSLIPANVYFYYLLIVAVSIFHPATNAVVFGRPIVDIFKKGRGIAMAVVLCGPAVMLIPLAPTLNWALGHGGWRGGYFLLGTISLLVGIPSALLGTGRADAGRPRERGAPLGAAVKNAAFWLLVAGVVAAAVPLGGIFGQLTPLLRDGGLTTTEAALLASLFGVAAIVGRCSIGLLLDFFYPPAVAVLGMLAGAAACAFAAWLPPSIGMFGVVVALLGCAVGAVGDIEAFFVARHFGLFAFSTVYGVLSMCLTVCMGVGGTVFAAIRDATGAYHLALMLSAALFVLAGLFFGLLSFTGRAIADGVPGWQPLRAWPKPAHGRETVR